MNQMLRFAREFLPKTVMMENVPELIRFVSFRSLCRGLRRLGYDVKFEIKDAARYGVPQRRKRLMMIAGRTTAVDFGAETSRTRTVRAAIGRLTKPGKSRDALHNMPEMRSKKI